MARPLLDALSSVFNSDGSSLAAGTIEFYRSGTTTPVEVYSTNTLATSLGTSLTANSGGRFQQAYFDPNIAYKAILKTASGGTVYTIDPISSKDAAAFLAEAKYTATSGQTEFQIPNQVIEDKSAILFYRGGSIQSVDDYELENDGTNTTVTADTGFTSGQIAIIRVLGVQVGTTTSISSVMLPVVQAGSLAEARAELGVNDEPSILNFIPSTKWDTIAARTNTDDLTSYFNSFFAAGGGTIPEGRYWIDPVTITNPVYIRMINAEIYQKSVGTIGPAYGAPNYTITRQALWKFDTGSEGSTVTGEGDCWFDGQAGILSQTGTFKTSFSGEHNSKWGAIDAFAERVAVIGVNFRNFITFPLSMEGDNQHAERIRIEKCGQGLLCGKFDPPDAALTGLPVGGVVGQTIKNITLSEIANDGEPVFQHACDVFYSHFSSISDVTMEAQGGDSSGYSTYASGFTAVDCIGTTFEGIVHSGFTSSVPDLAISLVGLDRCVVTDINISGHRDNGLEVNSCSNTTITGGVIDGSNNNGSSDLTGVFFDVGAQYPEFNRSRRKSRQGNSDIILSDFVISRCKFGVWAQTEGVKMVGVRVIGARNDGFWIANFDGHSGGSTTARMTELVGCSAENCGRAGLYADVFDAITINGFKARNNGQDTSFSTITRSGIYIKPTAAATRVSLQGYETIDDQGVTYTGAISFNPGAADANFRKWITLIEPDKVSVGQYITIEGGLGSGSDATGKIVDQRYDEVQVEFSGATTLSSTGNTTALTGTWTTDGTDSTKLNGSGTNATIALIGQWVTDGSQWRQIVSVGSTTIIYVSSAFGTPLAASTLSKLLCDLTTIKSQRYGTYIDPNSLLTALFIAPTGNSQGNITADSYLADYTVLEKGSMFYAEDGWGLEYHETAIAAPDLIADDTAANAPSIVIRASKLNRYSRSLSTDGANIDEYVWNDAGDTATQTTRTPRSTGVTNFYKLPTVAGISIVPTPEAFGCAGNGSTDDTTNFLAFLNAGGGRIPNGKTYLCGAMSPSARFTLYGEGGTLKRTTGTHSTNWLTLGSSCSGSRLIGFTMDGNRAASTFSTGVTALRISSATDVVLEDMVIQNAIAYPLLTTSAARFRVRGLRLIDNNATVSLSGIDDGSIENVLISGTDNRGLALFQHAFDMSDSTGFTLSDIVIRGHSGDASGLSAFISGFTFIRCYDGVYSGLKYLAPVADAVYILGLSFVGGGGCTASQIVAERCRAAVELAGVPDILLDDVTIDGEYYTTTATPSRSSLTGIVAHAGSYYSTSTRAVHGSRGVTVSNYTIRRTGQPILQRVGDISWVNGSVEGADLDCHRCDLEATSADDFPASIAPSIQNTTIINPRYRGAKRAGIMLDEAINLSISGGEITNNGQDSSTYAASLRAGISMQGTGVKSNVSVHGTLLGDTQSFTATAAASFNPGSTSSNRYTFSFVKPLSVAVGEYVTLTNVVSGPASATGLVYSIFEDEYTLEFSGSTTFVDTSVLTAGAGTISSSGTTVTGIGTAFDTAITGRVWIKADGEYRQVTKVSSATSLTISSAFTAPLSGDTYQIVLANVVGVPSQQHGAYLENEATNWDLGGARFSGNVVSDIRMESGLSSYPNTFAPGSTAKLFASGNFDTGDAITDCYASIPAGYNVVGYRFQITTAVSGTTGATLALTLEDGGSVITLDSGLAVTLNTKSTKVIPAMTLDANTTFRATFSGGADNIPSAGAYRLEILIQRATMAAFADV